MFTVQNYNYCYFEITVIECPLPVFSVLFHILTVYQHISQKWLTEFVGVSRRLLQMIISCSYLSESPGLRPPDGDKGHTAGKECVRHRTARLFRSRLLLFDGRSSHLCIGSCILDVLPFQYSLCTWTAKAGER